MYKVFVNDKPLFLTNEIQKETDFQLFLLESIDIKDLIIKIYKNRVKKAFLYHPDEKEMLRKLKSKIPVEKAGGGLVYNQNGEILFIFRNKKWDLPKGGIEKFEEIEQTAMREVQEETGVNNLKIIKKLEKTYHVFKRNGRYKLKITHWFEMQTTFTGAFVLQESEGIENAEWVKKENVHEKLNNSYENIKLLFENTSTP
jgi:ADP-ribose pyrophosphatase YjhB (NUDIX family)